MTRIVIALITFIFVSSQAHACRITRPFTDEELTTAQSMFVGELIETKSFTDTQTRSVTFKVIEVLSGRKIGDEITVNLYWSALAGEGTMQRMYNVYGPQMIVGIRFPDKLPIAYTGGMVFDKGSIPPQKPWIMDRGCSRAFLFPVDQLDRFRELVAQKK